MAPQPEFESQSEYDLDIIDETHEDRLAMIQKQKLSVSTTVRCDIV